MKHGSVDENPLTKKKNKHDLLLVLFWTYIYEFTVEEVTYPSG